MVAHGGPGAWGEMAPVARVLATRWGVLEPMQSATTFDGQVRELAGLVALHARAPATLVGFSWGAWLAFATAATRPDLVARLVLVGSGPFEAAFVPEIAATRASRLGKDGYATFTALIETVSSRDGMDRAMAWRRLGELAGKMDAFDPLPGDDGDLPWPDEHAAVIEGGSFASLVEEASAMRREGKLLDFGRRIECPVVAIHGDHDPHPSEGVILLQRVVRNFQFILLDRCGHKPWIERHAREAFFSALLEACEPGTP